MPQAQLDQLRKMTTIVADSGDFELIKPFHPQDSTTNPSLILQVAKKPEYQKIIAKARLLSDRETRLEEKEALFIDSLTVLFGIELLKIIPGRVSTEVAASLSFDTDGSIKRALRMIHLYEEFGIPKERVLIKLASTWEGIRTAQVLETEGIHCNMTLIFSLIQAAACAEAKATLISPFVGRILDWHKQHSPNTQYTIENDPGVSSTKEIYCYLKHFSYPTAVMGASFRTKEQVLALAGIDLLTISPHLLQQLSSSVAPVEKQLSSELAKKMDISKILFDESTFRFYLNENQMAIEKLAEGIRIFHKDAQTLSKLIDS